MVMGEDHDLIRIKYTIEEEWILLSNNVSTQVDIGLIVNLNNLS